jgi:hypothetical protein
MISAAEFDTSLGEIENLCEAVSLALLEGTDLEKLEQASADLREAAVRFSAFTEKHNVLVEGGTQLRARLKRIVTVIHLQRESLLRLAAQAERNLHVLLPEMADKKNVSYDQQLASAGHTAVPSFSPRT